MGSHRHFMIPLLRFYHPYILTNWSTICGSSKVKPRSSNSSLIFSDVAFLDILLRLGEQVVTIVYFVLICSRLFWNKYSCILIYIFCSNGNTEKAINDLMREYWILTKAISEPVKPYVIQQPLNKNNVNAFDLHLNQFCVTLRRLWTFGNTKPDKFRHAQIARLTL